MADRQKFEETNRLAQHACVVWNLPVSTSVSLERGEVSDWIVEDTPGDPGETREILTVWGQFTD